MSDDRDEPFPLLPITSAETLRKCASLPLRSKDVFVTSFPKSGTTWMQHIVHTLATNGESPLPHISDACPFFEVDRTWDAASDALAPTVVANHDKIGCRIFNTHLRWSMMPKSSPEARYVYMTRRAVDACVSFYHHLSHQSAEDGGFRGDLDEFIGTWTSGTVFFGSWSAHLASWLPAAAADERILVVSYEELRARPRELVGRVNAHCGFGLSDARLDELVPRFAFDWMRAHEAQFEPRSVKWVKPAAALKPAPPASAADGGASAVGAKRPRAAGAGEGEEGEEGGEGEQLFHFIRAGRVGDGDAAFGPEHRAALRAMALRTYGSPDQVPAAVAALLPAQLL